MKTLFNNHGGLREQDPDGPDGGEGRSGEDDVLTRISENLETFRTKFAELETKAAENSELKAELEGLQKTVKEFSGLSNDINDFQRANAALERKLNHLRREQAGDPLQRILGDEEKVAMITAGARCAYYDKHRGGAPKELREMRERLATLGENRAVLTTATPGSTYIDDELLTDVYQLAATYGIWNIFDVFRPSSKTIKMPVDTSDPDMLVVTEGTAASEEAYAGSTVTLNIDELVGWIGVSNSMLEDDEIGLARHLLTKFMRQYAYRMDYFCMNADGGDDAANGQQTGIFQGGTAYTLGSGDTAIADIVYSDFIGLQAGADEALIGSPTSRWYMHPQILVQLLDIKDSNGRPIFLTALEAPSTTALGSILGDGIVRSNAAPKADGASATILAYGDTQGLAVAVRKDFEFAGSTEVEFKANKTVFRAVARGGVKIKDATAFEVLTLAAT